MRAVIDIDEVKQFISSLGTICGTMNEKKSHINHEFKILNEVWRDTNYTKFEKDFNEAITDVDRFLRYAEAYADYLQRKAQAAERYLDGN